MNEDLQTLDELLNRFNIRLSDCPEEAKQKQLTKEDKKIIAWIYGIVCAILSAAGFISWLTN